MQLALLELWVGQEDGIESVGERRRVAQKVGGGEREWEEKEERLDESSSHVSSHVPLSALALACAYSCLRFPFPALTAIFRSRHRKAEGSTEQKKEASGLGC